MPESTDKDRIVTEVKERYGGIAAGAGSCCGCGTGEGTVTADGVARPIGYDEAALSAV